MLAELLKRIDLDLTSRQLEQLEWLSRELVRWNQRRNLTAITEPASVCEKHLVDSLTLYPCARDAYALLDIGSGAGFPALPLKIACPKLAVTSIEAVLKKVNFQRHVIRSLGLAGATALHGRAEEMAERPECRGRFDLVTARALAPLPRLVELAAPFMAPNGRLVAMKGPDVLQELDAWGEALLAAGWSLERQRRTLPSSGAERWLISLWREKGE